MNIHVPWFLAMHIPWFLAIAKMISAKSIKPMVKEQKLVYKVFHLSVDIEGLLHLVNCKKEK